MILTALSASQAERFDPEQVGGCPRRWFLQNVERVPVPEPEGSKLDGHAGHALFAMHYRGEDLPKRHRTLKAVRGALAVGHLPAREPGQLVESRFDGQAARDANGERVQLDTTRTLWIGGVPWDGYIDLRFYRDGMITVLDHKFSSDIHAYAKAAEALIDTVQMPVYALDSLRLWPEAQHVELVHHYVSRKGVDSFLRRQVVSVERVRQRGRQIAALVERMKATAAASSAEDVPGNRKACHTWSGCPFQSRCTEFKEKPKMELDKDELSWLEGLGGEVKEKPTPMAVVAEARDVVNAELKEAAAEFVKSPVIGPEADAATELEIASAGGALDPDDDPFAVFAPKSSVPQEQPAPPPSCPDCSTELNAENGSQRDGKWIHVGCPAKSAPSAATGPKCPNCPHPAHDGAACTGKRGRGSCRCGAQGALEKTQDAAALEGGHLPMCVQNDAGKWLCMEGCTATGVAQRGTHSEHPNGHEAELKRTRAADPIRVALCRLMERLGFDSAATFNDQGVTTTDIENMIFAGVREEENRVVAGAEARVLAGMTGREDAGGTTIISHLPKPIPMLLWCPACHARHVDSGEHVTKPHRSHVCQSCGLAWRPAVVATVGVQFLPGFKDE